MTAKNARSVQIWVHEGDGFEPLPPYRSVQMMSKHRDPKTVMRYDRGRENLEQNAVNSLQYEEESSAPERERAEELRRP